MVSTLFFHIIPIYFNELGLLFFKEVYAFELKFVFLVPKQSLCSTLELIIVPKSHSTQVGLPISKQIIITLGQVLTVLVFSSFFFNEILNCLITLTPVIEVPAGSVNIIALDYLSMKNHGQD